MMYQSGARRTRHLGTISRATAIRLSCAASLALATLVFMSVGCSLETSNTSPAPGQDKQDDSSEGTADDIDLAQSTIAALQIGGFSDWIFLHDVSDIPSGVNDRKSPSAYANMVHPPLVINATGVHVVKLYTWNGDNGLLSEWIAVVEEKQVVHLWARVVDVAVGRFETLRTEGFVPAPGIILFDQRMP